jgi:adenylate cyclase
MIGFGTPKAYGDLGSRLSLQFPARIRLRAFAIATGLTLLLWLLMLVAAPLFGALDHWTADLRTAFFTYRLPTQHPQLAIVYIDEEAIAEAQKDSLTKYRSPVDRGLLTRIVEALDAIKPAVIGLDIIIDQPTEPRKDAAFLKAVQQAKAQIVLARLDFAPGKAEATEAERAYHEEFLRAAARASGYVTVKADFDGVVRTQPAVGTDKRASFPEEIAKAGHWIPAQPATFALTKPSNRIAWLQSPQDNSATFLEIPAVTLIASRDGLNEMERGILATLKDRLVVVGVRYQDRTDRHRTPLNKAGGDLMPGAEINANVIAQLIDGRSYNELTLPAVLALSFVTALSGFLAAWRLDRSGWLVGSLPFLAYVVVTALLFWTIKLILPFAAPAAAWALGVYAGRFQRWREPKIGAIIRRETLS